MHFFLHSSLENFLSGASCRYCQTHSIVNNYFFRCNSMGCMADGWLTCPQPASLQQNAPDTTTRVSLTTTRLTCPTQQNAQDITKKHPGHYNAAALPSTDHITKNGPDTTNSSPALNTRNARPTAVRHTARLQTGQLVRVKIEM